MSQDAGARDDLWVICGDTGGTNAMIGVLDATRLYLSPGFKFKVFADGKRAATTLEGKYHFIPCHGMLAEGLVREFGPLPKVVITAMYNEGDIGHTLVKYYREDRSSRKTISIIIAVQDYWGGYISTKWEKLIYHPAYICVNDFYAGHLVARAWENYPYESIKVTGPPAFDRYLDFDVYAERLKVRLSLKLGCGIGRDNMPVIIGKDEKVVLYVGGMEAGVELSEFVKALNDADRECVLIARGHPNMAELWPEQFPIWQEALSQFRWKWIDKTPGLTASQVIAGCNVIASGFSTMSVEAAAMGVENNITIGFKGSLKNFKTATGNLMEYPPIVTAGCSAMAKTHDEMVGLLREALDLGLIDISPWKKGIRPLDGLCGKRVLNVIMPHLY